MPNAIDLLTIDKTNSGLYMELFTGLPDDYYDFYLREWEYNSVNLYISSQGHIPMDIYGRPFKAGSAASVKLFNSHYANLPDPYSNCQYAENMNTDLVKNIRNANISYDRYNCVAFCQQILAFNASGYYYMNYPNPFGLRLCETYDECMSIEDAVIDDSVCSLMCPPECEQYTYEYDVSLSDFPSFNYAYKLINDRHDHFKRLFQTENITYDMFKKSVSSFHFYFDELVIKEITASPSVVFVDLISNIGGIFGLFVGLSVLSFVEIIELAFNITNIIIKLKRLRKNYRLRKQNIHICS